jgi:polysaccharide biosynthesis PFTS motif protein
MWLFSIFVKKRQKNLKRLMRGYIRHKRNGGVGIEKMRLLQIQMVDIVIPDVSEQARKVFFGSSFNHAEILVRQFLLQRYAGRKLYSAILKSAGSIGAPTPIRYPLPKVWRVALAKERLPICHLSCLLHWILHILLLFFWGVLSIFKILFQSVLTSICDSNKKPPAHVYFYGLTYTNLPVSQTDAGGYDLFTWYSNWRLRRSDITAIGHGVKNSKHKYISGLLVSYIKDPTLCLSHWKSILYFSVWSGSAICAAFIDMLRGRWWTALLLAEGAKAAVVRLQDADRLAKVYLFHFSGGAYRPMWTYEAEEKSSIVACYFYSTCEQPKLKSGYVYQRFEWGPANWSTYIVWDDYQEQVLRRDLPYSFEVLKSGPISFSDTVAEIPDLPRICVAVFDMQPHRKSIAYGVTTIAQYWAANPNIYRRFLIDTHTAIKKVGATMILKAKREIGLKADKGYCALADSLKKSGSLIIVPVGIAAPRVLMRCNAAISVPFTSTALYFRDREFPSVYYDPSGWIQKDDKAAHGIPIISGPKELLLWLESLNMQGRVD